MYFFTILSLIIARLTFRLCRYYVSCCDTKVKAHLDYLTQPYDIRHMTI